MITYPATPVLLDAFMVEFNQKIAAALPWLVNTLGKVQGITANIGGQRIKTPRMFVAGKEYNIEVYPNDKITNYSWFVFGNYASNTNIRRRATLRVPATFNMFLDLRKIYPLVSESRDLENVKIEVLNALANMGLKSAAFTVSGISEQYEDVYSGFSLASTQDKFFMQPYAGLSFSLDLFVNTQTACAES